jgi:hypothetical protein
VPCLRRDLDALLLAPLGSDTRIPNRGRDTRRTLRSQGMERVAKLAVSLQRPLLVGIFSSHAIRIGPRLRGQLSPYFAECSTDDDLLQAARRPDSPLVASGACKIQVLRRRRALGTLISNGPAFGEHARLAKPIRPKG